MSGLQPANTTGLGPLKGIKVLDASMGAVGPWAGVLLGALGADVVKLESPQGDFIRMVMPTKNGLSSTYITCNLNKRGIVLDLKTAKGLRIAHGLVAQADVFIENFRPGVAERIGVGYETLSKINPRLIYASASGFGRQGPMVGIGATDPHIQAFTGGASVNGSPGGLRQRWRWYGHFDCTTAMCITEAVLAALYHREVSGKGQLIRTTMVEAGLALQRVRIAELLSGGSPRPMGSATTYLVPDQAFETQDKPIALSVTSRRQWDHFCQAIGNVALRDDPRFSTNPRRVEHRDTLIPLLQEALRTRPAAYWLQVFAKWNIPCATFTSFDEFRYHTHYLENDMVRRLATRDWGWLTVGGVPWAFSKTPGSIRPGSPPGEHTEEFSKGSWPELGPDHPGVTPQHD